MNKFSTYTTLALASLAVIANCAELANEAMSEAFLNPSDDQETVRLEKVGLSVFSDFCISSRDYVQADIKRKSNELSSKVFGLFFRSAEDMAREAVKVQGWAKAKLTHQLANPNAEVEPVKDGVAKTIAEGQQRIKGQNHPLALFTAFKAAFLAMSEQVGKLFSERLDSLKSLGNAENVAKALKHGCDQAKIYEKALIQQLEAYKSESLTPEAQEQFESMELEQIPCITSSRIVRIEGLCNFVRTAEKQFLRMLANTSSDMVPPIARIRAPSWVQSGESKREAIV